MARKKKQTEIPGTQVLPGEELDEYAAPYCSALYRRMELEKTERKFRGLLLARMVELGIPYVEVETEDGAVFDVSVKDGERKLHVKRRKQAEPDGEAEPFDDGAGIE